jgi:hypothetical protein
MTINFKGPEDSKERDELIKSILPQESIVSSILEPAIEKTLFNTLAKCIRAEIEIYRKYPKLGVKKEKEAVKEAVKTFDPRNNGTCFVGKAFRSNNDHTDGELVKYRKAIGTIPHPIWGDCTLMEIWGGDHFEEHNKMVTKAFKYGMNLIDTCPVIKVHVNPLFQNKKSKKFLLTDAQKEHQEYMDDLLSKAMVFGVKTPAQSLASRKRR